MLEIWGEQAPLAPPDYAYGPPTVYFSWAKTYGESPSLLCAIAYERVASHLLRCDRAKSEISVRIGHYVRNFR